MKFDDLFSKSSFVDGVMQALFFFPITVTMLMLNLIIYLTMLPIYIIMQFYCVPFMCFCILCNASSANKSNQDMLS